MNTTIAGTIEKTRMPVIRVSMRRLWYRVATYAAGMQIARARTMDPPA